MTTTIDHGSATSTSRGWHEVDPDRWTRELAELDAAGWDYRITRTRRGVGLIVHYPMPDGPALRLRVRFRQSYPWVPPVVTDIDGRLRGARHVDARGGELCLVHYEHWRTDTTVAALFESQLPRLLESGTSQVVPAPGLEFATPEPVNDAIGTHRITVVVNDTPVPTDVDSGVLLARFAVHGSRLTAGVVESVLGPDLRLDCDLPAEQLRQFPAPVLGRWLRDPDYSTGESPAVTWRRIAPRLAPLDVDTAGRRASVTPPDSFEIIGLLVPDEVAYRTRGESWVFLARIRGSEAKGGRRYTKALATQYLSRELLTERLPAARALQGKDVVVVGLGAIGMPIAQDLAQSQVGRMVVIDADTIDVRTGVRQVGSPAGAGVTKASWARDVLTSLSPYCDVDAVTGCVETLWDVHDGEPDAPWAQRLRQRLASADLVVCATANLPVTRLLSAVRLAAGKPLLVASGTAGGWGGVVTLLRPDGGCWACVEHARLDGLLPTPPADPDGWVTPMRCSDTTYTGARHQSQTIAMHASAVAIAHLTGQPMAGDYYVAALADAHGRPQPVSWTTADLPRHPSCPLHRDLEAVTPSSARVLT